MFFIKTTSRFLATPLLAGTLLSLSLATPVLAAERYTLDPMHTAIVWHINHFGFSNPSGKFMDVDGTLMLDLQNPAASKVTVNIPVSKIDTDIPKLDEHLKSNAFLDAATFPKAVFTTNSVDVTSKDTAIVHGLLSLHGVTHAVDLNVKLNKLGENMFKKPTVGFSATGVIKRSDFGITTYLPGLGDEVRLDIESEATLTSSIDK